MGMNERKKERRDGGKEGGRVRGRRKAGNWEKIHEEEMEKLYTNGVE